MTIRGRTVLPGPASPPSVNTQSIPAPAPALVWRTIRSVSVPQGAPGVSVQAAARGPAADAPRGARQAEAVTQGRVPAATVASAVAPPAPALSGPAIDRLAEDVMQRIERRIRIERERRGL
jgi:hypothetical protein